MKKERVLIYIAISGDRNVVKKEAEKVLKYEHLETAIERMWNAQTNEIVVTREATGTVSKSFTKYLSNLSTKHKIKELRKTAILGTLSCNYRIRVATTLYTLETYQYNRINKMQYFLSVYHD
jgi:hypothetical protein